MDHPTEIKDLISRTEEISGYPVTLVADSALTTHSALAMARGSFQSHVIRYQPQFSGLLDYIVAYHCGFIQRFFSAPTGTRMDFGVTESGKFNTEKLVKRLGFAKTLSTKQIDSFCSQILMGLMTHLRSTPIGLRVESWIESEFPQIADQQKSGVEEQIKENLLPLKEGVRKMTPELIFDATLSISAAYAVFWAQRWNQPQLLLPYKSIGCEEKGNRLIQVLAETPDSPEGDRALVDAWADELGIGSWHT